MKKLNLQKRNPYRKDITINLTNNELEYKRGYLRSLYRHLDMLLEIPEKRFLTYRNNRNVYDTPYLNGWREGMDDAYIQYKNIPKRNFLQYIREIKNEFEEFENTYNEDLAPRQDLAAVLVGRTR